MKNRKRFMSAALAAGMLIAAMPLETLAATKYISSVSLKVHTDLDAGDSVNDGETIGTENDGGDGTYVYTTGSRYEVYQAEWANDKDIGIGDEPKMYVWLQVTDSAYDDEYKFRSSYSSNNVSVSGGSYVSASRSGSDLKVTIRVSGIKGTYDAPEDAEWSGSRGRATWDKGEDSTSYFDVYLYRGSTVMKKLEEYNGTSYNFYPYMTKEGDYTFKVRAVPHSESEKRYGKKSEWTESDDQYIDEDEVSDGSGQTSDNGSTPGGGTTDVGWRKDGDRWYFRYPDGNYQKAGWLRWNDKWYFFDNAGIMLTGWQETGGNWYYLANGGDMRTGWIQSGGLWYYCNPNKEGPEGAMVKNSWLTINGLTYFVNQSGVMVEGWYQVENNWYYFQPGSGNKVVNTTVNGFKLDANGIWQH